MSTTALAVSPPRLAPPRLALIVASVALHGLVLALLLTRQPARELPQPQGQTMTVAVAPIGTTHAAAAAPPKPVTATTAPPVAATAPPPPPATAQASQAPHVAPPPPAANPADATQAPQAEPPQALITEPPPEKPVVERAREEERRTPRRPARREPDRPVQQQSRTRPVETPPPTTTPGATSTAPTPINPGNQQTTSRPRVGNPAAAATYASELSAWLQENKRYPRQARIRRIEGTAVLYFKLNRQGHVIAARIQTSSGSDLLDEETLAMVQRSPAPPPPPDIADSALEKTVPIRFSLR